MGRKEENEALETWSKNSSDSRQTPLECKRGGGSVIGTIMSILFLVLIGYCIYRCCKRKSDRHKMRRIGPGQGPYGNLGGVQQM